MALPSVYSLLARSDSRVLQRNPLFSAAGALSDRDDAPLTWSSGPSMLHPQAAAQTAVAHMDGIVIPAEKRVSQISASSFRKREAEGAATGGGAKSKKKPSTARKPRCRSHHHETCTFALVSATRTAHHRKVFSMVAASTQRRSLNLTSLSRIQAAAGLHGGDEPSARAQGPEEDGQGLRQERGGDGRRGLA